MSENERRLVSTPTRPSAVPPLGPSDTDASGKPPGPPLRANLSTCTHKSAESSQPAPSASGQGPKTAKPGRRRRAAESTNVPKNQHFYFVDQNSSSKEKRAHVMRHHVQEKKETAQNVTRGISHRANPRLYIISGEERGRNCQTDATGVALGSCANPPKRGNLGMGITFL
ncbi:hypothetical protein HAV15_003788 [Penicillium sp. str. |nr:hypothetical protein HAV15_003788 [Penicillium sp. str. \